MNGSLILLEQDGPSTVVLTLNRPEKRNALSLELLKQLCDAVKTVSKNPANRILVLKGAGAVFCSGLDLKESSDQTKVKKSAQMVARMLLTVHECPLVTIAAVHGGAFAGGAGLMSACDFVVVADDVKIGYPEVRRGLVAALIMTLLRRQLRERDIRELVLTAEAITAQRALEMGLVNRVVPTPDLMQEVQELVASIIQGEPLALAQSKHLLDDSWPRSLKSDLQRALKQHLKVRHSSEAQEGIAAFLEKRSPWWSR